MQNNGTGNSLTRRRLLQLGAAAGALAMPAILRPTEARADKVLNLLSWPGHGDPYFVKPFEEEFGVTVRAKEYVGGEQMLSLINSVAPGTYDVVLVDREYIPQLKASDKLQKLDKADYPFDQFFPEMRTVPELSVEEDLYAVPLRMNWLGLCYNSEHVTAEEAKTYKTLWSPKLKGKVGWFDWYLPSMGVISLYNGNKKPFDISDQEFARLKETLFSLKDQTSGFYSHSDIQTAFADGNCYALAGNGDSSTQILKGQGLPIETAIPQEGGLGVVEALAIPTGSGDPEMAKKFIQYATSAEGQVRSALLPAYVDYVPSMPAWDLLAEREPDWATRLRMRKDQHPNVIDDLKEGRIAFRHTPVQQSIEDWNQVWTEFKSL